MAKTLLPPGCYDLLPPFARLETELVYSLLSTFEANGYAQASPPLLEYTESLLAGRGAALAPQVFRLMDASAHQVMGLRADITLQIARIAASRLSSAPLPLRLSYAGPVLRAANHNARSGRQLMQAGIELIGPDAPEADAEVILIAAKALQKAGLPAFSIDLNMPGIVLALLESEALDNDTLTELMQAIAHKDASAIRDFGLAQQEALEGLLAAAGTAEEAMARLKKIHLPPPAVKQAETRERVAALVQTELPDSVSLTMDVTEARGLEYHTGVTFSFFVDGAAAEIGFGGRYRIEGGRERREATGCTLYVNALGRLIPASDLNNRVFIATPTDNATITALQEQGFVTVRALPGYSTDRAAAAELSCTHYFADGRLEEV
jgi:ATP phosphoribosyltransferase regulatory subunit